MGTARPPRHNLGVPLRRLVCLALLVVACTRTPDPAHELATRLYAPCCWRQTLADHESPLATELRAEIARRLAEGETSAAIERSLVVRYGDRIHALGDDHDHDPRTAITAATVLAAMLGLVVIALVFRRRARTTVASRRTAAAPAPEARLVDQLDDELALID